MIKQIKDNIWKLSFKSYGSHVYLIYLDGKKIVIDTASDLDKKELISNLKELNLTPKQIDIILLTHNHPDHVGNINLFENAVIYGNKADFSSKKVYDINKLKIKGLKIMHTPGHTKGGICIYLAKQKILFSGDTLFGRGIVGRTDLEGGSSSKLAGSLKKLKKVDYRILCPGHGIIE